LFGEFSAALQSDPLSQLLGPAFIAHEPPAPFPDVGESLPTPGPHGGGGGAENGGRTAKVAAPDPHWNFELEAIIASPAVLDRREGGIGSLAREDSPPAKADAEQAERHLRVDFLDLDADRQLSTSEGLIIDRAYKVLLDLDALEDARQRGEAATIKKRVKESVAFQVSAVMRTGSSATLREGLSVLQWKGDNTTLPAAFVVDTAGPGKLLLDIYIHRDFDLLFAATIEAEIVDDGMEWGRPDPIGWREVTDAPRSRRSRAFRHFDRLQTAEGEKRALCIAVQGGELPDQYLVTVLCKTAELPLRATFSADELNSHWFRIRGILDRLRRDPLILDGGFTADGTYSASFADGEPHFRRRQPGEGQSAELSASRIRSQTEAYLQELALAGVALRSALFKSKENQIAFTAIQEGAPDGEVVQIWLGRDALDFVLPWAWIYDGPLDPTYRADAPKVGLFWGHRMIIEQVADCVESAPSVPSAPQPGGRARLKVRVGTWPFTETTDHYRHLAAKLAGKDPHYLSIKQWPVDKDWEVFLPRCDAHLLYFFAHGHTALPLTANNLSLRQLADDARRAIELALGPSSIPGSGEQPQPVPQHSADRSSGEESSPDDAATLGADAREALHRLHEAFDVLDADGMWQDHHIRLGRGYLKMEDLRTLSLDPGVATLVVLNMCESAQIYPSISDGLVSVFLKKGAIGVVGTEIAMPPHFADLYGRLLIEGLAKREPIGAILLGLRRHFLDNRNPLGMAYSYYGNVFARLPAY